MTQYQTDTGESVPSDVAEAFDPASEWDVRDPEAVPTHESPIGALFEGTAEGERVYVSERGHVSRADRYDHVIRRSSANVPMVGCGPWTYNDTPEVVHHDHYLEHVTKVIVVGRHGRTILNSRSGVLWWGREYDLDTERALRLGISLAETKIPHGQDGCAIERPDGFEKAVSGWHSSLEPSEQSDAMNAIAKGDLPDHVADNDVFPYAVKYGDTTNVCSQPASIYANDELRTELQTIFESRRAKPAFGGFS